ncbi:MAG: hypothetical protein ACI9OJ_005020 [Myxococcota bacterium]|jgi:hypothetical protein
MELPGITGVAVANGLQHHCALDVDGVVWCWGQGGDGQLGDGSRIEQSSPVRASSEQRFIEIAAGYLGTCAIAEDRSVWFWGQANGADRPTLVAGLTNVTAVGAPPYHCRHHQIRYHSSGRGRDHPQPLTTRPCSTSLKRTGAALTTTDICDPTPHAIPSQCQTATETRSRYEIHP